MRTRALWVAAVTMALVTVTAFAVISARRIGTQAPPRGALAAALAERVSTLMETEFRDVAEGNGGPVTCAARPFGVRPEGLTRAAEATTIYAWVYCRAAGAAPRRPTLLAPVAVRLGRQLSVRVPESGEGRERTLRRIFPADVRDALRRTDPEELKTAVENVGG